MDSGADRAQRGLWAMESDVPMKMSVGSARVLLEFAV